MDRTRMQLPSELTLSGVADLRKTLLEALRLGKPIELDAEDVTDADVAGLQILCALHREGMRMKVPISFREGVRGEVIDEAAATAGFMRVRGCASGCIWLEGHRG